MCLKTFINQLYEVKNFLCIPLLPTDESIFFNKPKEFFFVKAEAHTISRNIKWWQVKGLTFVYSFCFLLTDTIFPFINYSL